MTEAIALVIAVALALVLAMGIATAIAVAIPMALAMIVWNDDDRRYGERHGDAIAKANVAASESGFSFNILRLLAAAAKEGHRPAVLCTRITYQQKSQGPVNCTKDIKKLQKCFGQGDLDELELNGKKIFKNLDDRDKGRIGKVYGQRDCKYNPDIAETALKVAESMNCNTADELMSITEIVVAEVKGKGEQDLANALNNIKGAGKNEFISNIQKDLVIAKRCSDNAELKFSDPLKAVYHYRKHGEDFPNRILSNIEFYLGEVPSKIIQDANLLEVHTLQDGTVRKFYVTSTKDKFAVVTETPDKRMISSQYRKPGEYKQYMQKLAARNATAFKPEPVDVTANHLANAMGLASVEIYVAISGCKARPLRDCQDLDESVHDEISQQLAALNDLLANEE